MTILASIAAILVWLLVGLVREPGRKDEAQDDMTAGERSTDTDGGEAGRGAAGYGRN